MSLLDETSGEMYMPRQATGLVKAKKNHIKLVDYELDSDDDFTADSDEDPDFQYTSQQDSDNITDFSDYTCDHENNKLTRKRKRNIQKWKRNLNKVKRAKCLPYENYRKHCPAKEPKYIDCSRCKFQCTDNFPEEIRNRICKLYWSLTDYSRQKDFILKHVQLEYPKRRKVDVTKKGARNVSKKYYLENSNGKQRVCANFFEKTLSISNGPINTAIKHKGSTGSFIGQDKRGKKNPGNKISEQAKNMVKMHIESFPAMESHYVRNTSKKLYLDSNLSISKMHKLYKDNYCTKHGIQPVSEKTYRRIFCSEYNYSFFKPKKDLCATCSKYQQATEADKKDLEAEYTFHRMRATQCNEAKENDKLRTKEDSSFLTCTFDLQSVLQLPYSNVSVFYYSRKICVYNLTIYVGHGEDAHCYTWNELHGKRGSNEIGSILYQFLKSLPTTITDISLFCDTCGGQNRNQHVAALLLQAVQNIPHLKTIELKFLESGHSHMECNSMHSAIESAKKYRCAYTMHDWVDIFKSARTQKERKSNGPYITHLLNFKDFYDLHDLAKKTIKNRNKDETGAVVSWLKIKCLKFEKQLPAVIFYRYDHTSDYKKINIRGKGRQRILPVALKAAYKNLQPISEQKKADLIKLVKAKQIPEEFAPWYKNLKTLKSLRNRLPEPNYDESERSDSEAETDI